MNHEKWLLFYRSRDMFKQGWTKQSNEKNEQEKQSMQLNDFFLDLKFIVDEDFDKPILYLNSSITNWDHF